MEKNETFKEELENQYAILIKAKEGKEKKRFIAILVLMIITFIGVLVSIFFAYQAFSATKNLNKIEQTENKTFYQTLSTVFNGNQNLNLSAIGNGYELATPKVIQITNEGNTEITFDIKLTSINTSLLSTNNLVYTITRNNETSSSKELPLSEKVIVQEAKIAPEETITFVIKVAFKGSIETDNYSNYYNSKIVIEQKDNKSSLLE